MILQIQKIIIKRAYPHETLIIVCIFKSIIYKKQENMKKITKNDLFFVFYVYYYIINTILLHTIFIRCRGGGQEAESQERRKLWRCHRRCGSMYIIVYVQLAMVKLTKCCVIV